MTRFKVLFISCMAAMGLFAVSAVGAQAATWHICEKVAAGTGTFNDSNCSVSGGTKEWKRVAFTGTETINSSGSNFELSVPARGIVIKCTTQTSSNAKIFNSTEDSGTINFSSCKLFDSEGHEATACTVAEPITTTVKTHLSGTSPIYDVFEPSTGTLFTNITISGASCAAITPGSYEVTGNIAGETETGERVSQPLKFSEAISKAAGTALKFGKAAAFLSGTSHLSLSGAHSGSAWGAS